MHTITAASYLVRLYDGVPAAMLSDPDGQIWSRLCLLADIDRVEQADESFAVSAIHVRERRIGDEDVVDVTMTASSELWQYKSVRLRCFADRLELTARVEGTGTLGVVRLLGGTGVLPRRTSGTFRSSVDFASVFNPTPAEPIQQVRPGSAAVTLGIIGEAAPGRLHGVFSPPPLCLVFGRARARHATDVPAGDWLSLGLVASVSESRFTELRYLPVDGGFLLELDYDGHTTVDGHYQSPPLVIRPATDPWQALRAHRTDLIDRGLAPAGPAALPHAWWREPIFCGWGAQCARVPFRDPLDGWTSGPIGPDFAQQILYDEWLATLAEHDVVPGTVVIDDRWQAAYGTGEPDIARWPDLRMWIKTRHATGQRVLLWWKAWDPESLPPEECVLDPAGVPVAADPGSAAYRARVRRIVGELLGPDGMDADGFKIDFTQWAPTGRRLRRPGAPADAPWGIAALHMLLDTIYRAAKAAKPDALVITHTPHPGFADVTDMLRLNDVLKWDPTGMLVPAVDQLRFRHAVVSATMPGHPIDTDQWPLVDRATWRDYVAMQTGLGVPALYYVERIDGSGEELTEEDLALVARTWRTYRDGLR
jgi:hypothetical protein